MVCPFCKKENTKVIDSRDMDPKPITRRRRECENCNQRFTTYERLENLEVEVLKRSGRVEPFSIKKIALGVARAIRKNVDDDKVEELVETIEQKIMDLKKSQIKTSEIGEAVLSALKNYDAISYLRFASVYKNFHTLEEFENEIKLLR